MAGNTRPSRKPAGTGKSTRSKSPLTIRYSPEDAAMLKAFPRRSLARLVGRTAGEPEWTDVFFRIHTGLELAKLHIAEDITGEFSSALTALLAIELRSRDDDQTGDPASSPPPWSVTADEVNAIEYALDIADQIQDTTTRKEQLKVYVAVEELMQKRAMLRRVKSE